MRTRNGETMRRAAFLVLIMLFFTSANADAAGLFAKMRGNDVGKGGMFPGNGEIPDLVLASKVLTYRNQTFINNYGASGNAYLMYGLSNLKAADYNYGGNDKRIVIEIATMTSADAAAGLFHNIRGTSLANIAKPVDVGTEGMIDSGRGGRTVYFYKSNLFVKIIYSGKMPIPDIMPIARAVAERIPKGRSGKPVGFEYIDVPGVNMESAGITPGNTFSLKDLPPSVTANAPGGGSTASDLFVITRLSARDANAVVKEYSAYLRMLGSSHEEYTRGGSRQRFYKSVDPVQGRVVFTAYKNVVIIVARPDGYHKGEALIDAVMQKIDASR